MVRRIWEQISCWFTLSAEESPETSQTCDEVTQTLSDQLLRCLSPPAKVNKFTPTKINVSVFQVPFIKLWGWARLSLGIWELCRDFMFYMFNFQIILKYEQCSVSGKLKSEETRVEQGEEQSGHSWSKFSFSRFSQIRFADFYWMTLLWLKLKFSVKPIYYSGEDLQIQQFIPALLIQDEVFRKQFTPSFSSV